MHVLSFPWTLCWLWSYVRWMLANQALWKTWASWRCIQEFCGRVDDFYCSPDSGFLLQTACWLFLAGSFVLWVFPSRELVVVLVGIVVVLKLKKCSFPGSGSFFSKYWEEKQLLWTDESSEKTSRSKTLCFQTECMRSYSSERTWFGPSLSRVWGRRWEAKQRQEDLQILRRSYSSFSEKHHWVRKTSVTSWPLWQAVGPAEGLPTWLSLWEHCWEYWMNIKGIYVNHFALLVSYAMNLHEQSMKHPSKRSKHCKLDQTCLIWKGLPVLLVASESGLTLVMFSKNWLLFNSIRICSLQE